MEKSTTLWPPILYRIKDYKFTECKFVAHYPGCGEKAIYMERSYAHFTGDRSIAISISDIEHKYYVYFDRKEALRQLISDIDIKLDWCNELLAGIVNEEKLELAMEDEDGG